MLIEIFVVNKIKRIEINKIFKDFLKYRSFFKFGRLLFFKNIFIIIIDNKFDLWVKILFLINMSNIIDSVIMLSK